MTNPDDKIFLAPPAGKRWIDMTYEEAEQLADMLNAAFALQREEYLRQQAEDDGTEPHSSP